MDESNSLEIMRLCFLGVGSAVRSGDRVRLVGIHSGGMSGRGGVEKKDIDRHDRGAADQVTTSWY